MLVPPPHSDNLQALKSDGTIVAPVPLAGCTLANGTTYVFVLGAEAFIGQAPLASAQIAWDAAVVAVVSIEALNFGRKLGRPDLTGPDDVTDFDVATRGRWMKIDPSTAYVTVTSSDGTTGGATIANATVTVAGGTQGAAFYDLGNLGGRRLRVKVVVTTGGVVRCGMFAKAVG